MDVLFIVNEKRIAGTCGRIVLFLEQIAKQCKNRTIRAIYIKVDESIKDKDKIDVVFSKVENGSDCICLELSGDMGDFFIPKYEDILNMLFYPRFSGLCKKLQFNRSLLDRADVYREIMIDDNTLGLHLRMGDMNKGHKHYGIIHYEDYKTALEKVTEKHNITKIFLASDEEKNIEKLIADFPNIKINYIKEAKRICNVPDMLKGMKDEKIFLDIILDVLLLSKCKHLLYRVSNVANLAILLSDTLVNHYKVLDVINEEKANEEKTNEEEVKE